MATPSVSNDIENDMEQAIAALQRLGYEREARTVARLCAEQHRRRGARRRGRAQIGTVPVNEAADLLRLTRDEMDDLVRIGLLEPDHGRNGPAVTSASLASLLAARQDGVRLLNALVDFARQTDDEEQRARDGEPEGTSLLDQMLAAGR